MTMDRDQAIALFTRLQSMEYEVEGGGQDAEEEPFISGFGEPTYEVSVHAELLDGMGHSNPVQRGWAVEIRFSESVYRPEGTDQLRALLDLADEAGVDLGFPSLDRVRFT